jgi:hypothetical protein
MVKKKKLKVVSKAKVKVKAKPKRKRMFGTAVPFEQPAVDEQEVDQDPHAEEAEPFDDEQPL